MSKAPIRFVLGPLATWKVPVWLDPSVVLEPLPEAPYADKPYGDMCGVCLKHHWGPGCPK